MNNERRGHPHRSPDVEQLAVAWLAGMAAGDAAAVASLFAEHEATTVIGNGADQWFTGDAYTSRRLDQSLGEQGGIPFEPGSLTGWAAGDVGWFAGQVSIVFPATTIPLRMTGVAIRPDGRWRLVQLHVSAAVSDEDLLAG
jgi:ketosteroid isomerase-like protein